MFDLELILDSQNYICYRQPVMYGNTNCYIVLEKSSLLAAIIDPGADGELIIESLNKLKAKPQLIINTHGHWDHIGANKMLAEHYNIPIAIHQNDAKYLQDSSLSAAKMFNADGDGGKPDHLLTDGELINLGSLSFKVIHCPGHTQGGICLELGELLFSGDSLFNLSIGRTDLEGGDYQQLMASLAQLCQLDEQLLVLPGHGAKSTLGYEKKFNPYLRS